jgi:hypothetical protein
METYAIDEGWSMAVNLRERGQGTLWNGHGTAVR